MHLIPLILLLFYTKSSAISFTKCFGHKSDKLCKNQSAEGGFWVEQFQKGNFGPFGGKKLLKIMNELSTKQRLLEAIYDKVPEDRLNLNGHFSMDEYKYLKTRHNQILHNDPALSQVLQSLINAETSAKLEMKFDYFDNLLVKKLKQQLAFALIFIAKRNRIQFEHNLTKIDQNDFLQKLTKFLHQVQNLLLKTNNATKRNLDKTAQIVATEITETIRKANDLQFVAKSLEIDWNATAPSNRQPGGKRRRKRQQMFYVIILTIFVCFCVIFLLYYFILCAGFFVAPTARLPNSNFEHTAVVPSIIGLERINNKYLEAFEKIPPIFVDKKRAEEEDTLECAICLSLIDLDTKIRPLPNCQHIFHNSCIVTWIRGGRNSCPICRQKIWDMSSPLQQNDVEHQQNVASSSGLGNNSATQNDAMVEIDQINEEQQQFDNNQSEIVEVPEFGQFSSQAHHNNNNNN